jgi:hypothetical protein
MCALVALTAGQTLLNFLLRVYVCVSRETNFSRNQCWAKKKMERSQALRAALPFDCLFTFAIMCGKQCDFVPFFFESIQDG